MLCCMRYVSPFFCILASRHVRGQKLTHTLHYEFQALLLIFTRNREELTTNFDNLLSTLTLFVLNQKIYALWPTRLSIIHERDVCTQAMWRTSLFRLHIFQQLEMSKTKNRNRRNVKLRHCTNDPWKQYGRFIVSFRRIEDEDVNGIE